MIRKRSIKKVKKIGRDAITGRFLPIDVARRRKKTAIVETIKYY